METNSDYIDFDFKTDHFIIFTQIFIKLPLYTKWAKIKSILETSTP